MIAKVGLWTPQATLLSKLAEQGSKSQDTIRLVTWNAQSLGGKQEETFKWMLRSSTSVMCIQELGYSPEQIDKMGLNAATFGYHVVGGTLWLDKAGRVWRVGLAFVIRPQHSTNYCGQAQNL